MCKGKTSDHGTYLLYLPPKFNKSLPHTLVYALSPNADANALLDTWCLVADKHQWIVASSKVSRNGVDYDPILKQIKTDLNEIEANYTIARGRVVFTGMSGGGMGAYAVTYTYPDRVDALVINTGMMAYGGETPDYPRGKIAAFLASPSDFRYPNMQADYDYLTKLGWSTEWFEFEGGHTIAPPATYEQAAVWLDKNLP